MRVIDCTAGDYISLEHRPEDVYEFKGREEIRRVLYKMHGTWFVDQDSRIEKVNIYAECVKAKINPVFSS